MSVPREPTLAMVDAGCEALDELDAAKVSAVWQAMFDAGTEEDAIVKSMVRAVTRPGGLP